MSIEELINEIRILTQKNITLKEELAFYQKQEQLHNFDMIKNILNDLQNNTFIDDFHNSTIKISISDNYLNGIERSFLVDTLSPEFLTALTNELKNSLVKKAVQLNDLLLQTGTYQLDEEWLNELTYKPSKMYRQKDYVFKVGDKVKVTSCGEQYDKTENFDNNWDYDMSDMVNDEIIYTITDILSKGIELNNFYRFPAQSLTLVESVVEEDEYLKEE